MTLLYYGIDSNHTTWQTNAALAKQAEVNLKSIICKAVNDGFTRFASMQETQSDRGFTQIAETLAKHDDRIQCIAIPTEPADEPREMAVLRTITALLKNATMLVIPLESAPRSPLSVQLSRMALDAGVQVIVYDDQCIQRIEPKTIN